MKKIYIYIYLYVYIHTGRQTNSKTHAKDQQPKYCLFFFLISSFKWFARYRYSRHTPIKDEGFDWRRFLFKKWIALFWLGRLVWFDDFLQAKKRSRGSQTNSRLQWKVATLLDHLILGLANAFFNIFGPRLSIQDAGQVFVLRVSMIWTDMLFSKGESDVKKDDGEPGVGEFSLNN